MVFFGYISSLLVAVGLVVFYIGNITHHFIITSNNDVVAEKVYKVENHHEITYFVFETNAEYIGKVINQTTHYDVLPKAFSKYIYSFKRYHNYNNYKLPLDAYSFALFKRPPPEL